MFPGTEINNESLASVEVRLIGDQKIYSCINYGKLWEVNFDVFVKSYEQHGVLFDVYVDRVEEERDFETTELMHRVFVPYSSIISITERNVKPEEKEKNNT